MRARSGPRASAVGAWGGLAVLAALACGEDPGTVALHKSEPRNRSERDAGTAKDPERDAGTAKDPERDGGAARDASPAHAPSSVKEKVCDGGPCPPPACEQAIDCTPGPCQRFACIDGVCTQVEDRPTQWNEIMGTENLPCGDGFVCGPGILASAACCEETCSNGCGGPSCSSNGNSPYCCVGVIERGEKGHEIAPLCSDRGKPPCNAIPFTP